MYVIFHSMIFGIELSKALATQVCAGFDAI